jgi:hypothetical protein
MMRSTKVFGRSLLAGAVAVLMAAAFAAPAGAAASKSTLSISSVSVGKTLAVSGKVFYGSDATAPAVLVTDPAGDDADRGVPNGTDFTSASIKADPVKKIFTFSFTLADPNPFFVISPGWDVLWGFTVDGKDTNGYHLQIGNVGGLPPGAGPYFLLCTLTSAGFACDHELKGDLGSDGVVTAEVPFDVIGAVPGTVIGGSSKAGAGPDTITSNLGMGAVVFEGSATAGETIHAKDYYAPGRVSLGIAPAGTNFLKVPTTVNAVVKGTGYSGSLPKPKPGNYIVVAKTCFGAGKCLVWAKTVKV